MNTDNRDMDLSAGMAATLDRAVEKLSAEESLAGLSHQNDDGLSLPSAEALRELAMLFRSIMFPGFYGNTDVNLSYIKHHIGVSVERFQQLLESLTSREASLAVVEKLPQLRQILATDVEAAYNGDPAAEDYNEIIVCYPVIKVLTNYRLAHELHVNGVKIIPRALTEMAHSETGIDIHPGATIGHHFTIDHGTGVVIGATCIIGNNVKLYQGVTLGAKSFPLDDEGNPIKGIPRHPILEDDVVVYSNATVLGRITIGKGTVIGGNLWVTHDTAPGEVLVQKRPEREQ